MAGGGSGIGTNSLVLLMSGQQEEPSTEGMDITTEGMEQAPRYSHGVSVNSITGLSRVQGPRASITHMNQTNNQ